MKSTRARTKLFTALLATSAVGLYYSYQSFNAIQSSNEILNTQPEVSKLTGPKVSILESTNTRSIAMSLPAPKVEPKPLKAKVSKPIVKPQVVAKITKKPVQVATKPSKVIKKQVQAKKPRKIVKLERLPYSYEMKKPEPTKVVSDQVQVAKAASQPEPQPVRKLVRLNTQEVELNVQSNRAEDFRRIYFGLRSRFLMAVNTQARKAAAIAKQTYIKDAVEMSQAKPVAPAIPQPAAPVQTVAKLPEVVIHDEDIQELAQINQPRNYQFNQPEQLHARADALVKPEKFEYPTEPAVREDQVQPVAKPVSQKSLPKPVETVVEVKKPTPTPVLPLKTNTKEVPVAKLETPKVHIAPPAPVIVRTPQLQLQTKIQKKAQPKLEPKLSKPEVVNPEVDTHAALQQAAREFLSHGYSLQDENERMDIQGYLANEWQRLEEEEKAQAKIIVKRPETVDQPLPVVPVQPKGGSSITNPLTGKKQITQNTLPQVRWQPRKKTRIPTDLVSTPNKTAKKASPMGTTTALWGGPLPAGMAAIEGAAVPKRRPAPKPEPAVQEDSLPSGYFDGFAWNQEIANLDTSKISTAGDFENRAGGWVRAQGDQYRPTFHWRTGKKDAPLPLISDAAIDVLARLQQTRVLDGTGVVFGRVRARESANLSTQSEPVRSEPVMYVDDDQNWLSDNADEHEFERYFIFLNVDPGAHLVQSGEGAVVVPVRADSATFVDLTGPRKLNLKGTVISANDGYGAPGTEVVVRDRSGYSAISDREGNFRIMQVHTFGTYPIYLQTNPGRTDRLAHNHLVQVNERHNLALYEFDKESIRSWVDLIEVGSNEGDLMHTSGLVMGAMSHVSADYQGARMFPLVYSLHEDTDLRSSNGQEAPQPEVYTLDEDGNLLVEDPLLDAQPRFFSVKIPEGHFVAEIEDAERNRLWSQLYVSDPGVLTVIAPTRGRDLRQGQQVSSR